MESIKKRVGNITVTVDYKTELLGIIMIIGNYHLKYPHLFKNYPNKFYVDRIINKFGKYKDEETIKLFDELVFKYGFSYDAPYALMLCLDNDFNYTKIDDYVLKRVNYDSKIYDLIKLLKSFAFKIHFNEYYNSNKDEYTKYVNSISNAFIKYDIIKFLQEYLKDNSKKEFIFNLIPFTIDGAYSASYNNTICSYYPVFEEMKQDNLYDCFGFEKYIVTTPLHEFLHGFINPITDELNLVNKGTHLFDNIRKNLSKQAYTWDSNILNEHIIRTIEIRYIVLQFKDIEWAKGRIEREKNNGFIYIENVLESLIYYEQNINDFESFKDFYPTLIDNLKQYKKKKTL